MKTEKSMQRIRVVKLDNTTIEISRQYFDPTMGIAGDWIRDSFATQDSILIEKDRKVVEDLIDSLRRVVCDQESTGFVAIPSVSDEVETEENPIPFILSCPACGTRHIDEGEFATKPHHTHACQHCGVCWRPAVVNTVGVRFLPGFKNEER